MFYPCNLSEIFFDQIKWIATPLVLSWTFPIICLISQSIYRMTVFRKYQNIDSALAQGLGNKFVFTQNNISTKKKWGHSDPITGRKGWRTQGVIYRLSRKDPLRSIYMEVGEKMFISRYSFCFGVIFRFRWASSSVFVSNAAFALSLLIVSCSYFFAKFAFASAGDLAVMPKRFVRNEIFDSVFGWAFEIVK